MHFVLSSVNFICFCPGLLPCCWSTLSSDDNCTCPRVSKQTGWLARGELTWLAWFSYRAVVPQGLSPGWERKPIVPATERSPVLLGSQTKVQGQGSPCRVCGMRFFRFLCLVGRVLLVRDELKWYSKEKTWKGDICKWSLRVNCPPRTMGEAAAVSRDITLVVVFLFWFLFSSFPFRGGKK